jgi:heavy metal translocating P-type ATPase
VRLADRYSIPFTLVSFAIAGAAWGFSGDSLRFLQVIVVATPCPLLLAAPIAIISGMSRSSKHGIIIRTGSALERLARIKTIAFDKTGTLTSGKLVVDTITTYNDYKKADVLGYAAAVETSSGHILSHAINEAAMHLQVKVAKAHHVKEVSGRGMSASVGSKKILIGRKTLLDEHSVKFPSGFRASSVKQTATYIAIDGELAGVLTFSDTIRPETPETLEHLQKLGVTDIEMITGDNKAVATGVASQLGITQVVSEALPGDKLLAIENIRNRPVGFVGDGVNDAPVLTAADVGIALGARGSTAASESADVVIMVDDISRVATGVAIAKRTFRITRQSILVGIALSVILMFVFATGKFPPLYGAIIQEFVDVVVIFNALRAHSDGHDG